MTTRRLYVAEPRAVWLARPPVVADCSVLAAPLFAEPQADETAALLQQRALHAPSLLPCELARVALMKQRADASPVEIDTALTDFAEQRIEPHPVPPAAVTALAARHGVRAYDAACPWLAAELRATLLTSNQRLMRVAQQQPRRTD